MEKIGLSALEKEMANFNYAELNTHTQRAKANIATRENLQKKDFMHCFKKNLMAY